MPLTPLPLIGPAYTSVDHQMLDQRSPMVRNFYVNAFDFTEKRPGLEEWVDLGTSNSVDGLYWWDKQSVLLAVSNGQVFKISDALGTTTELTASEKLLVGQQTTFADNGTVVLMANGTQVLSTSTVGPAAYLTDGDAPTTVTHVAFLDQYAIANVDGTGSWQISEAGDYSAWRAIDIFTAESNPDEVHALHVGLGEIALFGSKSIEFWLNDGVSPFARINAATIERGIIAPHSVALVDDRWICLDQDKKVIEIRGRQPVEVSGPFDKVIQSMTQHETAIGDVYRIDGFPLYILTFPVDHRTFVYNYQKQDWAEWDYFDQDQGTMLRYRGNCYAHAKAWNLHIVGDYANGKLYKAGQAYYDDDGTPIRCVRRTGFVSHGNYYEKESKDVYFRVKQSVAITGSVANPQMMVRYRNADSAWNVERWINLGPVGDHENVVRLNQLGQYRTRQWEIAYTDATSFELGDAQEDVEVLAR